MKTFVYVLISIIVTLCTVQETVARRGRGHHGGHHKKGHHLCNKLMDREMRYMSEEERDAEIVSTCLAHQAEIQLDLSLIWDEQSGYETVFKNWIKNMTEIMEGALEDDDDNENDDIDDVIDEVDPTDEDMTDDLERLTDDSDNDNDGDDDDEKDDITLFCERKKCFKIAVAEKMKTDDLPPYCDDIDMTPAFWSRRGHDRRHDTMSVDKLAAMFCVKADKAKRAERRQNGRGSRVGRLFGNKGGRASRYE